MRQTYRVRLELATVHTHALEHLFHLAQEADVEHGPREVDVPKVPRALGLALATRLALVVAVDGAEARVGQAAHLVLARRIVLHLRVLNLAHRKGALHDVLAFCLRAHKIPTISSGLRIPNWTSFTWRTGATDCANWCPIMAIPRTEPLCDTHERQQRTQQGSLVHPSTKVADD